MPTDFTHIPINAETFLDKLACGFGRVVLFLQENDAAPFREAIVDSCLHHRAFDRQTEDFRTDYLFDIMQATGEPEFYAARIRQALGMDNEDYSYGQLYELAARLAQNGDADARRVMYERFKRCAPERSTTGAEDLVALDGLDGYLFVAGQWQRYPLPEDDWEEAWLLDKLEEKIGQEKARQALEQPEFAAYFAEVKQKRAQRQTQRREHKPREMLTYDDIKARIADPTQTPRWPIWRRWARKLDEAATANLAQDLLIENDRVPLLKLLHLFREQPFPLAIDRLIDLAQVRDEEISEAALWALGSLTDPRIRALALQFGADGEAAIGTVNLLRNNFQDGDYERITQMLSETRDVDDFHRLGMTVRDIIQAHPLLEAKPTLNVLYQQGRCVLCRQRAVELLASLGPLPPWILAEGCYDADTETRALIAKSLTA